jgi:murein DD-endopeptidase MepM/ murein hydrolase activator NlpD
MILMQEGPLKIGQKLEILPVTGVSHKVAKGETIYSIAKRYDAEPQAIVNFPFNTFVNDETFELAVGQELIVPEGVRPVVRQQTAPRQRILTPDAGTVVASGSFVWPASGTISQYFSWYHQAIDIANRSAPNILAADAGRVTTAGWPDSYGYGNRVVIDHGNGYQTLYAHLQSIYVVVGQSVSRGAPIGRMGTTGRSTGIHLHFEVYRNGVRINPLTVLQ